MSLLVSHDCLGVLLPEQEELKKMGQQKRLVEEAAAAW